MPYKAFTIEEATSSDVQTYLMNQSVIVCTSGTRPGSPVTGMRIWQTDTLSGLTYTGSSWEQSDTNMLFAYKPTDESVSASTTLQDDDNLFLSVAANYVYILEAFLAFGANAGGGQGPKIAWSAPSGCTMAWSARVPQSGASATGTNTVNFAPWDITTVPNISIDSASTHTATCADIYGVLVTGGSAGTLQLRWAQNVSQGVPATTLFLRSWLRLTRIS